MNGSSAGHTADDVLTVEKATRLTVRIRGSLNTIAEDIETVVHLVEQARTGGAHEILGYASWAAYVADAFGGVLARLSKAERVPLGQLMAEQGMSTRAIASVVGVSKDTVSRDLRSGVSPDTRATPEGENHNTLAGETPEDFETATSQAHAEGDGVREPVENRLTAAKTVTGIDGKNYPGRERRPPHRPQLPKVYADTVWDLERLVRRLEKYHRDDRLGASRERLQSHAKVLEEHGSRLLRLANDLRGGGAQ